MPARSDRFPALRRGLGVGFDLPWGAPVGFTTDASGRDRVSARLRTFLTDQAGRFNHVFFSWQPRDRGLLRLADYQPGWDDLADVLPAALPRALHHTALNLAEMEPDARARREIYQFTNALCERYGLAWINEDVGFWSVSGRPVPYPLPPLLDEDGLAACVRNVRECQKELIMPLVIEFPGFAAGVSLILGDIDAYDFFRCLADETGAPVTLDVAHLLSWRWWRGWRGEALYGDLDRLPLESCFEIHLSGCEIEGDQFIDAHHGRLVGEQLAMLGRLVPLCPNLRAITFEDPRLGEDGAFAEVSVTSLASLERVLAGIAPEDPPYHLGSRPPPPPSVRIRALPQHHNKEGALASLLYDREARESWRRDREVSIFASLDSEALEVTAAAVRAMVRQRTHRGTGPLVDMFPRCIAGWRTAHQEDGDLDELFGRFLASPSAFAWRERSGCTAVGACIETCFAAYAVAVGLADEPTVEEELASALLRTLAVTPEPNFLPPPFIRRGPRGWYAVTSAVPPVLHAATDGRYLRGPVTPLIVALLGSASIDDSAVAHGIARSQVEAIGVGLVELGLLEKFKE